MSFKPFIGPALIFAAGVAGFIYLLSKGKPSGSVGYECEFEEEEPKRFFRGKYMTDAEIRAYKRKYDE